MKKIKKTLSVTLLMLGLVSIGAGASYATDNVNVDPIEARAELYDWMATVNKLGATDESTSSVICGAVLEGDTLDELDDESFFTLHEGSGVGFALNGQAFTPAKVFVPAENEVHIDLGFEAQVGDVVTINGSFSESETWEMTIVFNNCALAFDGNAWVAKDRYTTYTYNKLNGANGCTASVVYAYPLDGDELVKEGDWNSVYTLESGAGLKLNDTVLEGWEMKQPGDLYFDLKVEAVEGDVLTINGTFASEGAAKKYVFNNCALRFNGTTWESYVQYEEYDLGAVKYLTDANASSAYFAFANGVELPISSWDYAFAYVSGNGITVDGTMINMTNSVKSVGNKLYAALGVEASVGSTLKIGGVFSNEENLVKYIIEDSEFKWDGAAWVSTAEPKEYTTHEIGKLTVSSHSSNSGVNAQPTFIYLDRADGQDLPIQLWENPFTLESGDGLKLNGEAISLGEMQSTNAGIYLTFAEVKKGDTLSISGTFVCPTQEAKYVIEESKFTWNGTTWEDYVEYTTHEIGKLTYHDVGDKAVYLKRADGVALEIATTENDLNWTTAFAFEAGSGVGITLNGTQINMNDVKFPETMYIGLGTTVTAGDILVVEGTFYSTTLAYKYIIEKSEFKWNGTAWVSTEEPAEPKEYETYNLGALVLHVNSSTGGASGENNQLYLTRADGEALPVLSWDVFFAYESGDGFKVNGASATAYEIKSTGDGFYWLFNALSAGDVVSISGTFVCEDEAVKYIIEESKFVWNGTGWEAYVAPVEYTTYTMNKINGANGCTASVIYAYPLDGDELVKEEDWNSVYTLESGEGLKLNDTVLEGWEMKQPGDLYFNLKVEAAAGDKLTINGTFASAAAAKKYVFNNCVLVFDGTTWKAEEEELPPVNPEEPKEYTTHEIGKLTYENVGENAVYLKRADGKELEIATTENDLHWTTAFAFEAGSGAGITLNGTQINMNDVKFPGSMYIGLGTTVEVGDTLVVGGTFYSTTLAYKYIIEESEFKWNGTAWVSTEESEEVEYTTYTMNKIDGTNDCTASVIYAYPLDGDALVKEEDWNSVYTLESGEGLKLNDTVLEGWEMKQPGDLYFNLNVEAEAGDKLTINGTFASAAAAKKYVFNNCVLVFDGTTWKAEEEELPPVNPEITYTEYDLGAVKYLTDANASSAYFAFAEDVELPISSWDYAFAYVSGNGITVNDVMIDMTNSVKSVGGKFFANLGAEAAKGAILKIGGVFSFSNDDIAVKYIIEDSEFKWNGFEWVDPSEPDLPDEPITLEIGKLAFHVNSTIGNGKDNNSVLYLQRADGEVLPVASWDVTFAYVSGDGFKVNGESATAYEIKSTPDGFYLLFDELNAGDVVSISGTFTCEARMITYVITESEFLWNGTGWEYYVEYNEYDLGVAVKITEANAASVHFVFAEGVELPISSWEYAFAYVSGNGITVDGVMIDMTNSVKSVGGKLFADLGAEVTKGAILKIGGVFSNVENAVKYIIEDSEFKWNGFEWVDPSEPDLPDEPVEVVLGQLALHNNSSFGAACEDNSVLYLQRADGEALTVESWAVSFAYVSGDGLKVNGESAALYEIKSTEAGLYLLFDELNAGDVVSFSGVYVCEAKAVKYVIEESKFVWTGSCWDPYVEYVTYDVGSLVFGSGSATEVFLDRADGEAFVIVSTDNNINWEAAFKLRYGSGVGVTLNGEAIGMANSVKFPNNMYISLGKTAIAGDVLVVGGTFYNVELGVEYIIAENELIFDGTTWTDRLTAAKKNAKDALDMYLNNFSQDNYYDAQWSELNKIVETAKASIDTAGAEADLAPIVTKAKGDMDAVLKKAAVDSIIGGVRASAKADLAAYKNKADYKDAEWAEIESIILLANATIDASYTEEAIETAVEAAKAAMDKVQTAAQVEAAQLKAWRESAKAEVQAYYSALNFDLYSAEANAVISGYVSTAMSAIDKADTKAAIDAAVAQFKTNVGNVEQLPADNPADSSTQSDSVVEDEGGCGSVVGSGVALSAIGLAAAAIVALRKKEDEE